MSLCLKLLHSTWKKIESKYQSAYLAIRNIALWLATRCWKVKMSGKCQGNMQWKSENCEQHIKTKIAHISNVAKCKSYFTETDYEIRHRNWKSYYWGSQQTVERFWYDRNLSRARLNGRGLHLNTKGMLQFGKNLIEGIQKLWNKKC